jgi:hypothetical protein
VWAESVEERGCGDGGGVGEEKELIFSVKSSAGVAASLR